VDREQTEHRTVTPYLVMERCADAIEFYRTVFGATEVFRTTLPDGPIGHAELVIGDSLIMVADAHPGSLVRSPSALGGTTVTLMLYVEDADEVFARAIAVGAHVDDPVKDKPYGDRSGSLIDPFGHRWTIATRVEDIAPDGMTAGGFPPDS
jgi:PhnB protein